MKLRYTYRGIAMLALLLVLLPGAAWRFALRDTVDAWRACRRLERLLEAAAPLPESAPALSAASPELLLSGRLLDTVRRAAEGSDVQVRSYLPSAEAGGDDPTIHTAQITLAGSFRSLLQTIRAIEERAPDCRLHSLAWQADTDRRTRRMQLTLTLYIQQIHPAP